MRDDLVEQLLRMRRVAPRQRNDGLSQMRCLSLRRVTSTDRQRVLEVMVRLVPTRHGAGQVSLFQRDSG